MSYNRGYSSSRQPYGGGYSGLLSEAARQSLLSKVFTLLSLSFLVAGVGVGVGVGLLQAGRTAFLLPAIILEFVALIALLITSRVAKRAAALNLGLLFVFTFASGLTVSAVIASAVAAGATQAVYEALAITGVLTVGLGTFAWTTRRNLSFLGPILFIGLLAILVASLFSFFFSFGWLSWLISVGSVVLFSGYIAYDVQRVKFNENTLSAAILLTVSLYLDILNLFLSLLRLLSLLSGNRRN